ncbi:hypothetical protein EJC49_07545 [Aquibium carbonis]|uniref:Uncharacterized protein n=1 Tax=Aquibium carbonis TaxID=2495581 RepID=A0A429YZU2_9HYPH|nr:hypothetical protein [Aquibium carbonis]RST86992.1 hypothetical protein EJC49_07545 [Aquibium carbonis]
MTQHEPTAPMRGHPGGLKPAGTQEASRPHRADGEMRGATLTLVIALYPLVGSVTVVIAALLLAGGALAG